MKKASFAIAALVLACGPRPTPESGDAEQAALARAKTSAAEFGGKLVGELNQALAEGSPADALDVCATKAPAWTKEASGGGVKVGRSSLRLRNAEVNAAPAWVKAWLDEHGERKVEGLEPLTRIDEVDGKKVARVIKPIGVAPVCLNCHGPSDTLAPEVKSVLAARYPDDQATGYELGDLRGALWAEAPVE